MSAPAPGVASPASSSAEEWFGPGRFAALLALFIVAAFPDVVFGSRTFFYRDFGIFGYPLAYHHRESFWQGEIPLWNPLNNCGLPFLAQWNTMVLYPVSLFYLLFPLSWSLGMFCLIHLFLAGIGMYFLARQWTGDRLAACVAGLAFAFNGLTLSCLKWPNNIAALAWMPFVVWLAERGWRIGGRSVIWAALAGAMQMLTGGPEIILFTWLLTGALWLAELFSGRRAESADTLSEPQPRTPIAYAEYLTREHGERTRLACCLRRLAALRLLWKSTPRLLHRGRARRRGADGNTRGRVCSPRSLKDAGYAFSNENSTGRGRMALRFFSIVGLVAGLTAAQMVPFLDLLSHSQRDAAYSDSSWSMPRWGWANFVVPLFRGFPSHQGVFAQHGQYWVSSYYAAIGVLALAGLALWRTRPKRIWLLGIATASSLVLALGEAGFLYGWLKTVFPPIQIVRFPIKFVVVSSFAIPLLAACGISGWRTDGRTMQAVAKKGDEGDAAGGAPTNNLVSPLSPVLPMNRPSPVLQTPSPIGWERDGVRGSSHSSRTRCVLEARCILILSGLLLVFISSVLWYAKAHPLPTDQWRATLESGLSRAVFLVLTLAAAVGIARAARVKSQIILGFSLLLLLWLDVLTHAPRLNPTVERWVYEPSLATAELKFSPAPSPGGSRAMVSPFADDRLNHLALTNAVDDYLYSRMSLFANANLLEQIPKIDGFFSLSLREENRVRSLLYASTNASVPNLAKFLGVSYLTAPGKMIDWAAQPGSLPFATAGQTPIFADGPTTVRALAEAAFDPSRFVYLPVEARSQTTRTNAASTKVAITRFTAHRIEFAVDAEEPAWFVAAQAFYHPWRAYVDGQERRIWPANHAFQALEVPAGRHLVELVYRDRRFQSGVAISGLTLLACAGLWFRSKP